MIDEALRTLIAFVESASPIVWQAAQQEIAVQVTIATRSLVTAIVFGLLFLVLSVIGIRKSFDENDDEWGEVLATTSAFGFVIGVVCFFIVISKWNYITALTMNPEYQAIKIISELITGVCN